VITNLTRLIQAAAQKGPSRFAVVPGATEDDLSCAALVRSQRLGRCTLIGDLETQKGQEQADRSTLEQIHEPDPQRALRRAVQLVKDDQADVLVVDQLPWYQVLPELQEQCDGLLCGVSVLARSDPERLLLVADSYVLTAPTLEERIGIVHSAVDVAHRLGVELPKVALVAAAETVNPKSQFTLDAAQITVMGQRKQIKGALIDGPLGFDNAVSAHAAEIKGIGGPVAGQADVLITPDVEAGGLLIQTLSAICHLTALHVIVGGAAPVVLWQPEQDAQTRLAAVALGVMCA